MREKEGRWGSRGPNGSGDRIVHRDLRKRYAVWVAGTKMSYSICRKYFGITNGRKV